MFGFRSPRLGVGCAVLLATLPLLSSASAADLPADSAQSSGPMLGFGTATWSDASGSRSCSNVPFLVEIVPLADGEHAAIYAEVLVGSAAVSLGALSCLGLVYYIVTCCSLAASVGPPPNVALIDDACVGRGASGYHCDGRWSGPVGSGNGNFRVDVGASSGPGSAVSFSHRGPFSLDGVFTSA